MTTEQSFSGRRIPPTNPEHNAVATLEFVGTHLDRVRVAMSQYDAAVRGSGDVMVATDAVLACVRTLLDARNWHADLCGYVNAMIYPSPAVREYLIRNWGHDVPQPDVR